MHNTHHTYEERARERVFYHLSDQYLFLCHDLSSHRVRTHITIDGSNFQLQINARIDFSTSLFLSNFIPFFLSLSKHIQNSTKFNKFDTVIDTILIRSLHSISFSFAYSISRTIRYHVHSIHFDTNANTQPHVQTKPTFYSYVSFFSIN